VDSKVADSKVAYSKDINSKKVSNKKVGKFLVNFTLFLLLLSTKSYKKYFIYIFPKIILTISTV